LYIFLLIFNGIYNNSSKYCCYYLHARFHILKQFLNTNTWKFLWHHSVKLKGKKRKKKPKSVQICDKIHKEILKRVYDEIVTFERNQ